MLFQFSRVVVVYVKVLNLKIFKRFCVQNGPYHFDTRAREWPLGGGDGGERSDTFQVPFSNLLPAKSLIFQFLSILGHTFFISPL